jgi:predicted RNA-binding protein with RPS1 domain
MSWTKRINHPSELVAIGDIVEVVVLDINKDKEEISLGMKQTEVNPWTLVEEKYPVGTIIEGRVRNLTNYGAFIELEEGIDGLLHVSDMSWTKKVAHPGEIVKKGEKIRAMVLTVDREKKRVALGMKQLAEDPWDSDIPTRFSRNTIAVGKVTNVTNFGVFVELEADLEGLLHISELADRRVDTASEVVKPGDIVEVKIIRLDRTERKLGLSLVKVLSPEEAATAELGPKEIAPVPATPEPPVEERKPEPAPQPGQYLLADQLKALQEKRAKEEAERQVSGETDTAELQPDAAPLESEEAATATDEPDAAPPETAPAAEVPAPEEPQDIPVAEPAIDEAPAPEEPQEPPVDEPADETPVIQEPIEAPDSGPTEVHEPESLQEVTPVQEEAEAVAPTEEPETPVAEPEPAAESPAEPAPAQEPPSEPAPESQASAPAEEQKPEPPAEPAEDEKDVGGIESGMF